MRRLLDSAEKQYGPDDPMVGNRLQELGIVYVRQGRWAEATPLLRRSLEINDKVFGPMHPSAARRLQSLAYSKWQEEKASGKPNVAAVMPLLDRAIAIVSNRQAELQTAINLYTTRAEIRKWSSLELALADIEQALEVAEQVRPYVGGAEEQRAVFFSQYAEIFDLMVAWQIEAGNLAGAIATAERARARVFLDQLNAAKVDLLKNVPADERARLQAREREAHTRLAEQQQRITLLRSRADLAEPERQKQLAEAEDSLQKVDQQYRDAYAEIKTRSLLWRDALIHGGSPVSLSDVQRQLVPPGGLMLIYQIDRDSSYVFVIPPAGQAPVAMTLRIDAETAAALDLKPSPLTTELLSSLIGRVEEVRVNFGGFLANLSQRTRSGTQVKASDARSMVELHGLWKILIPAELWPRLQQATEVVVVPDEGLYRLPFEALVVKPDASAAASRYWLDEGPAVRYAPSATVLSSIERRPTARALPSAGLANVLSFSDPIYDPNEVKTSLGRPLAMLDTTVARTRNQFVRAGGSLARLPGTAAETEAIQDAFRAAPSLGSVLALQRGDATEPNLRAALEGKRYLHFATHGLVDDQRGSLFAAMATTPPAGAATAEDDGFLQLHEIYQLQLAQVELAVLSACETNLGNGIGGEGPFALSRGFLSAGARRVVASQWAVEDRSTAVLIGQFFRNIVANEQSGRPAEYTQALRDAKRFIREQGDWAHPYYWASFVLMGSR
jgi:CHAT domain-containing protein